MKSGFWTGVLVGAGGMYAWHRWGRPAMAAKK